MFKFFLFYHMHYAVKLLPHVVRCLAEGQYNDCIFQNDMNTAKLILHTESIVRLWEWPRGA